jgi:hypothetical protein
VTGKDISKIVEISDNLTNFQMNKLLSFFVKLDIFPKNVEF